MGRWTQYDDDDYRLPSNVVRTGYDADEGRYYFKDQSNGKIYRGLEGQEFGDLEYVEGGEGDDETGQVEPEPTTIRDEAERVRRYAEDGPATFEELLGDEYDSELPEVGEEESGLLGKIIGSLNPTRLLQNPSRRQYTRLQGQNLRFLMDSADDASYPGEPRWDSAILNLGGQNEFDDDGYDYDNGGCLREYVNWVFELPPFSWLSGQLNSTDDRRAQ